MLQPPAIARRSQGTGMAQQLIRLHLRTLLQCATLNGACTCRYVRQGLHYEAQDAAALAAHVACVEDTQACHEGHHIAVTPHAVMDCMTLIEKGRHPLATELAAVP